MPDKSRTLNGRRHLKIVFSEKKEENKIETRRFVVFFSVSFYQFVKTERDCENDSLNGQQNELANIENVNRIKMLASTK